MMPTSGDHLLIALIAFAYPLYFAFAWHGRLRPRLESTDTGARCRVYRESMIELWLLTGAVLCRWVAVKRPLSAVGLGAPGGAGFWIGTVIAAAVAVALGFQVAMVHRSAEARAQVRSQVRGQLGGGAALMIPRDGRERRMWVGLSLTAGICEEVLYRAVLIWYLMTWLPAMVAVPISALVFGVPHLYLGRKGMLQATVTGAVFGVAYLLTGSIWVPAILHCTVDIASGLTASAGFEEEEAVARSGGTVEEHA